jgi:hypothetical protein
MSDPYYRVVGDTDTSIDDQLIADGSAVDISNSIVAIHIEQPDGTVITDDTNGNVTVVDAVNGNVKYEFSSGDLDQPGRYRYEWEVTFGGGDVLTIPSSELEIIQVREELA